MKLSTGETCRKCKPDIGACAKHLHLDPCYRANVVEAGRKVYGPKNWDKPQAVKPSPLPWDIAQGADGECLITYRHERGIDEDVARVYRSEFGTDEVEPNAALIVRAVNAHAGLVEALREIESMLDQAASNDGELIAEHPAIGAAMVSARAALRAAGEAV